MLYLPLVAFAAQMAHKQALPTVYFNKVRLSLIVFSIESLFKYQCFKLDAPSHQMQFIFKLR